MQIAYPMTTELVTVDTQNISVASTQNLLVDAKELMDYHFDLPNFKSNTYPRVGSRSNGSGLSKLLESCSW